MWLFSFFFQFTTFSYILEGFRSYSMHFHKKKIAKHKKISYNN